MKNNGSVVMRRILHEGVTRPELTRYTESLKPLPEVLPVIPSIVDQRTDQFWKEVRDFSDLGPIALPFPRFWAEGPYANDDPANNGHWGAVCVSLPGQAPAMTAYVIGSFPEQRPFVAGIVTLEAEGHKIMGVRLRDKPLADFEESKIETDGVGKFCLDVGWRIVDLLYLMSCKNVCLMENQHDPATQKKLTKIRGKNFVGYRYHTLAIKGIGESPHGPGAKTGTMPLHVCRGHMRGYGPEFGKGLLFGRYAGLYFIPAHARGNARNGFVDKDYFIPPSLDTAVSFPVCASGERAS